MFRRPALPLHNNIYHAPYGDTDAVEQQLRIAREVGNDIAAVVMESIQGEAGAIVPPDDFWPRLRQFCDEYEVLLIAADALQAIYPDLEHRIVVTIMGAVAAELYMLGHRHNFFYLEHAMGLASSMGLGIALAMPDHQVIVIDGDGSLLMNLGTLSTLARYKPGNLLHLVFDNESLLSVGGFPTATSTGTDLAGIARASGVPQVVEADTTDRLKKSVQEALASNTLTTIVSKVEAIGPKSFHMDLPLLENRFQFARSLEAMRREGPSSVPR